MINIGGVYIIIKKKVMRKYLKFYRIYNKIHDKIIFNYGLSEFGLHPKNVFNYRSEFFIDNVNRGDVVIDIACGTGLILKKISPKIKMGYGVDYSYDSIKTCIKKHSEKNLKYIHDDISKIDYKDFKKKTNYTTAIFSHILEHIENVPELLKKVSAKKILICVPSKENWKAQLLIDLDLPYFTDRTHFREYDRDTLKNELKDAGYKIQFIGFNPEGEIICKAVKGK